MLSFRSSAAFLQNLFSPKCASKPCLLSRSFFSTLDNTIFSVATSVGRGAIAVVRISGRRSSNVLLQVTPQRALPKPRFAQLSRLHHPVTKSLLDHALVLWFPAPASFTGEDMVELQLHGGRAVVSAVLRALAECQCDDLVRPAEAGEFSKRAFLNGKMDATEAEGLLDLIDADTDAQRELALAQMQGSLGQLYSQWREKLVNCLAHVEAVIDFGEDEEDVNTDLLDSVKPSIETIAVALQKHLNDGRRGEMVRSGVRLVIAGPPNAGKSSLLNVIAKRPAAIVSSIPGTTRDVVEVRFDLAGMPIILADTAGLRETNEEVEKEGISRARQRLEDAHLKVFVFDNSQFSRIRPDDVSLSLIDSKSLIVLNKCDIQKQALSELGMGEFAVCHVSCKDQTGLDFLLGKIEQFVRSCIEDNGTDAPMITRERHRHHVTACHNHLKQYLDGCGPLDLQSEHLRLAVKCLGQLTGRVDVEDLLDVVFRDFCIGK